MPKITLNNPQITFQNKYKKSIAANDEIYNLDENLLNRINDIFYSSQFWLNKTLESDMFPSLPNLIKEYTKKVQILLNTYNSWLDLLWIDPEYVKQSEKEIVIILENNVIEVFKGIADELKKRLILLLKK